MDRLRREAVARAVVSPLWYIVGLTVLVVGGCVYLTDWYYSGQPPDFIAAWNEVRLFLPTRGSFASEDLVAFLSSLRMAVVGTAIGSAVSLPIAVMLSDVVFSAQTPRAAIRGVVGLFRAVPDIVWGIVLVVILGFGELVGVIAIALETVGFCGRFYADALDDSVDPGGQEILEAFGGRPIDHLVCRVLPRSAPSLVGLTLYSFEKGVRAAVVLGIVGAGGIGLNLRLAVESLNFDRAGAIILGIWLMVGGVEAIARRLRERVRGGK